MPKFVKGQSGNPAGSSRRARGRARMPKDESSATSPSNPPPEPQSLHDEVLARLTAIMRTEPDVGYVLGACRLLVDRRLAGPEDKLDLEMISREMHAKNAKADRMRALEERGTAAGLPPNFDIGPDGQFLDEADLRAKLEETERREAPKGGLRDLSPADQAILAARHVDQERHRRGQNVPEPPSVMKVEPEPTKPPDLPAFMDSRIIWHGDLPVFPGLVEE